MPEHQQIQQSKKTNTIFQKQTSPVSQTPVSNPYSIIQRARINPKSLTHADIMQLQRTIGNQAVGRLLSDIGNTSTDQQATVQRQEISEKEEACPSCLQKQEILEEEEPLQGKMLGTIQRQEIPEEEEPLQTKRENNTGMPDNLKAGVENLSGIDMSDVRVHYNSDNPAEVGALAYTQGTNIHVAPGQEKHLPHEGWHAVQQMQGRVKPTLQAKGVAINDDPGLESEADTMGERAREGGAESASLPHERKHSAGGTTVVQGYFEKEYLIGGSWLQSDDMTVVAKKGYPNHELYAIAGKAYRANSKLEAVNSGIELIETATQAKFWQGSILKARKLNKIEVKNKGNRTQGDKMQLYADCGKSNAVVIGGEHRQAVYYKPDGVATTVPGDPLEMKIGIIKAWMAKEVETASEEEKLEINGILDIAKPEEVDLDNIKLQYDNPETKNKELIEARKTMKLKKIADIYWGYYNKQTAKKRERIDKTLKINRHAMPIVGQGYTISSGGDPAGKPTWNFHWGGVVMTSEDGKDTVVLENFSVGNPGVVNERWTFDIYGTEKKDQSFHERHKDTRQHGLTPTTMVIEKVP